jgi:PBSX family phage portal protein
MAADKSERVARQAESYDEMVANLPTVNNVFHITREEKSVVTDPFAKDGEFAKSLGGLSPNLKRRVTNELKKFNRSADHNTESKQLDEAEIITGYDAFGVVEPPSNLETYIHIYELSAPHYAAVNAKIANIVGLGYKFVETNKTKRGLEATKSESKKEKALRALAEHRDDLTEEVENFNEEDTFTETLEKVWRDYEVMGNGYIEIGRNKDNTIGYVGHIPAQTIRIRRERDGFVQINGRKAVYFRNFGDHTPNPIGTDNKPNELIHIKRYSPSSTYYGVPDVVAAQQAIAGNEFSARFNLDYFENKAVPRHLITLKGANLGIAAQTELLGFFETGLKGQNHRSLFIPLPSDDGPNKVEFKIDPIDTGNMDASFNKYRETNLSEILMAHRVPISKVSTASGTGVAVARDADKTFKEQVCQPQQRLLEKKVNRIIKELTDAYELKFHEMSLTDTNTQSQIDERMVKNGIWIANEIRARDGMTALDGGDERVDPNGANKIKEQQAEAQAAGNRARDAERSANQTDSTASSTGRNPKGEGRTTG